MTPPTLHDADALLGAGFAALGAAAESAGEEEVFEAARIGGRAVRRAERQLVACAAELSRRGAFAARGVRTVNGLMELLGLDHQAARRVLTAAENVVPRTDLQGQLLPPLLPATASAFSAGLASLQHVQVVAGLLASAAAHRLPPAVAAEAERMIAGHIGEYPPAQLRNWGRQLLEALDQDGAAPAENAPPPVNELALHADPGGAGGTLRGRFEDPALFELIATVIDAKARPVDADDRRPAGQRQAEALADVFGYVAVHGDREVLGELAGRRPQVNITVTLTDLENRAGAACLDLTGIATPAALRLLCCDARVVPVVMGGAGQPLDVGRARRVVPDGLRRAVIARDRGCAHPGCDRPVSWSEIHHVVPWECGGVTALGNLVMLCTVHHRQIHTSDWVVRIGRDGVPEFVPPAWVDPRRRPRRPPPHPLTRSA